MVKVPTFKIGRVGVVRTRRANHPLMGLFYLKHRLARCL